MWRSFFRRSNPVASVLCCGSWALLALSAGCDVPPDSAADPAPSPRSEKGEGQGEDAGEDPIPGDPCFSSKECVPEEFCATLEGECGRAGVCTPVPGECPRIREPVCSCDGIQFHNDCFAAQSKQNVDFTGTCPPPICTSNADCDPADYCATAAGACGSDGACTPRPLACSFVWDPVCGCNDLTYANACKAAQVGVPVQHSGPC